MPLPSRYPRRYRPRCIVPSAPAPSVGLIYYTDNRLDDTIAQAVRRQIDRCRGDWPVISVSLRPISFGLNIVLPLERGMLTMFKQILLGLEASTASVIFLVEHDVLYHPSHFEFRPEWPGVYYYNTNNWKVDLKSGRALYYVCHQTLALCASRELLLQHYRARVERVEREGRFNRAIGFEPGDHRTPRGIDDHPSASWASAFPNLDVRHGRNLTASRWRQDQFRNPNACLGWMEAEEVPGWGRTLGAMPALLQRLAGEE